MLNPARARAALALIASELGDQTPVRVEASRAKTGATRACSRALAEITLLYTAASAPSLPLAGCDNPLVCVCIYRVGTEACRSTATK